MTRLSNALEAAVSTRRGNLAVALALACATVLVFGLLRAVAGVLPRHPASFLLEVLVFLLVVPLLAFATVTLLAQPARRGLSRAALAGLGAYLALGLLFLATGVPG